MSVSVEVKSFLPSKAKPKSLAVNEKAFGTPFNEGLVHQVITSYLECGRAGTYATKNRSDRSGGGAKPWRQKGTGRARAGTRSSPIWVGGGHTFARTPYDYSKSVKVNKKVYRHALRCILSQRLLEGSLHVVESLDVKTAKTKDFVKTLSDFGLDRGLLLMTELSENVLLASRNVPNVHVALVNEVNPYMLLHAPHIVMTQASVEHFSEYLA